MATRKRFKADVSVRAVNDEGFTPEMSALKLFTVANSHYQLSWKYLTTCTKFSGCLQSKPCIPVSSPYPLDLVLQHNPVFLVPSTYG